MEAKMFNRYIVFVTSIIVLVLVNTNSVHADLAGIGHKGKIEEKSLISAIYKADEITKLYSQFTAIMDRYVEKKTECADMAGSAAQKGCNSQLIELIEEVKDILAKLNEQAHAVESEIAMNIKNVDKKHSEKLDRILTSIIKMRQGANQRLKQSVQPI
jgi:hypothetical protein